MSRPLTVAGHHAAQHALRAACVCVSLCANRHPHEVVAEIAARAIAALRSKPSTPARP